MKNDKKLLKSATILLLVVMVALVLVSGTYAKYTTTVAGKDTAIVARWSVKANVGEVEFAKEAVTVNIFDESNIFDSYVAEGSTLDYTAAGTPDADVKDAAAGSTAIIAPGTWGKFAFTVSNSSEVSAKYSVALSGDEAGVPLEWSFDGSTWKDDMAQAAKSGTLTVGTTTPTTVDVFWRWKFEDTTDTNRDKNDTDLGIATNLAQPTATVTVTFDQAD